MNDPLEKLLKKMELSCYGKESDLIYRGDALNAIRGACIMAHIPFNSSSPEGRRTMEAIKAVWKVKSASTSLHGGWKNAKTEPPPPNTDVEVYCKALGVTVGYHRPFDGRIRVAIHNKKKPGLVHLLEHGHAKINGGRTKALPHVAPEEEKLADMITQEVVTRFKR